MNSGYHLTKKNGFTIWELLLVLVLLGLLTFMAVPRYLTTSDHIDEEIQKTNILLLEEVSRRYYVDTGTYPRDIDDLLRKPENVSGWRGPYLDEKYEPLNDYHQEYVFAGGGKVLRGNGNTKSR